MKKLVFIFICFFTLILSVSAGERQIVTLEKCVDGDTAWFNLNGSKIKTRFLAIDTPESTNKVEKYGKEASEFTCNVLKSAEIIEIEYDDNSDRLDKYDRYLVWVFVNDELLQEKIVKEGLAEIKYVYGDYKYLNVLNKAQDVAKSNKLNIWDNSNSSDDESLLYTIIVIIAIIVIVVVFKPKKSTVKKLVKKYLK